MKSRQDIANLLNSGYRHLEKTLGIQIRNGQTVIGIKSALMWVIDEDKKEFYARTKSLNQLRKSCEGAKTEGSKKFWEDCLEKKEKYMEGLK